MCLPFLAILEKLETMHQVELLVLVVGSIQHKGVDGLQERKRTVIAGDHTISNASRQRPNDLT